MVFLNKQWEAKVAVKLTVFVVKGGGFGGKTYDII